MSSWSNFFASFVLIVVLCVTGYVLVSSIERSGRTVEVTTRVAFLDKDCGFWRCSYAVVVGSETFSVRRADWLVLQTDKTVCAVSTPLQHRIYVGRCGSAK